MEAIEDENENGTGVKYISAHHFRQRYLIEAITLLNETISKRTMW